MTANTIAAFVVFVWVSGWTVAALRELWRSSKRLRPYAAKHSP